MSDLMLLSPVDVSYIIASRNHKLVSILFAHRNNDLFMRRTFGSHFDARFELIRIIYIFYIFSIFLASKLG